MLVEDSSHYDTNFARYCCTLQFKSIDIMNTLD